MTLTCRADLEQLTATLAVIANWRDDLQGRIDRAHLCFELIGLSRERQDTLLCEGEALKRCLDALAASISEGGEA